MTTIDWEAFEMIKVEKYQEKVFNKLLKRYRIDEWLKPKLLQSDQEITGRPGKLRIGQFNRLFPTFPIQLTVTGFFQPLDEITVKSLLKGFATSRLLERYKRKAGPNSKEGYAFGMVFEWPQLGDELVLHNYDSDFEIPGARVVLQSNNQKPLILERFSLLLDSIDSVYAAGAWEPELDQEYFNLF